jgi:hypothetical protein
LIRVTAPDHLPREFRVDLADEQVVTLNAQLERINHSIGIESVGPGAEISARITSESQTFECTESVVPGRSCQLRGLPAGEAVVQVLSPVPMQTRLMLHSDPASNNLHAWVRVERRIPGFRGPSLVLSLLGLGAAGLLTALAVADPCPDFNQAAPTGGFRGMMCEGYLVGAASAGAVGISMGIAFIVLSARTQWFTSWRYASDQEVHSW